MRRLRRDHDLPQDPDVIFVEVTVTDPSDFEAELSVRGEVMHGRYRVMTARVLVGRERAGGPDACTSATSRASSRTSTSSGPRATPSLHFLRFLLFGQGEVAPVTREVLRRAEPDRERRPHVHVG